MTYSQKIAAMAFAGTFAHENALTTTFLTAESLRVCVTSMTA
jgi:hypothetical protein